MPSANTSLGGSAVPMRACSGDMYDVEPISVPGWVATSVRVVSAAPAEIHEARQAEIEHLHVAVGAHHDVLGLHVAMHDAGRVRRRERPRHLPPNLDDRAGGRALLDERAQRASFDQLLDDEVPAVRRLADIVDGDDVRVVQRRGGAGFAQKPLDGARLDAGVEHHLDRHSPVEPGVVRPVHLAHTALTEAVVQAIVAKRCGGHRLDGDRGDTIHPRQTRPEA